MNVSTAAFLLAAALASAGIAQAQSPTPPRGPTDPSAASTPHQRSTTGEKSSESPAGGRSDASAAPSPHQHAATSSEGSDADIKMAHADGMVPSTFTKKAALDGMTEVELGKLALQKSKDSRVRQFAQRMVTDHGKANEALATLAKSRNLEVPTELDAEHQAMVQKLSGKNGSAFDSAYSEHMVKAHANAVALFDGASSSNDAEVAAFAKQTLPTLKEHKQMARSLPGAGSADKSGDERMK
jgi:putative membrane protein